MRANDENRSDKRAPNILIIMADQLRYDCIGYSGAAPVATPHIDRLAAEGVWFTRAYSHIPICSPARQSLVCGLRPEVFGGLWNFSLGLKIGALEPSAFSWARCLRESGYRTGYVGKWDVHPQFDPTHYGYEEYVNSSAEYRSFVAGRYPELTYTNGFFGETDPLPLEHTRTHRTAANAGEMLARLSETGGPWHLRVSFEEPHLPCRPAAPFAARYAAADIAPWESFAETFAGKPYIQEQQLRNWGIERYTWDDWAPIVARYYAIVSQLDDAIGRLLKQLDDMGETDNTFVVFTSDHGDMCGGHRMIDKHCVLYEDLVRVPLAMRWPGAIPAGLRCEQFVYNLLDLPPTLLDVCGIAAPEGTRFHGASLVPLLGREGSGCADWRQEAVASYNGQQFGLYTQRMIRTRDWKYVWNHTDVDELYNLNEDPHELRNVASHPSHRDMLQELRSRLYDILLRDGDGMVNNEWMRRQLLEGRKK